MCLALLTSAGVALLWAALEIHNTIAELMICANSTVAEYIANAFPKQALLRRHPPPLDANLVEAAMVAARAGAKLKTESRAALSTSLKAVTTGSAQESAATDDRTTKRRRGAVDRLLRSLLTRGMAEAQYFCTGYVNVCAGVSSVARLLVHTMLVVLHTQGACPVGEWGTQHRAGDIPPLWVGLEVLHPLYQPHSTLR